MVRVAGDLQAANVLTLQRACRSVEGELRLDLSGLRTADAAGIEAIEALRARGASIVGASTYIRLLLERRRAEAKPESPDPPATAYVHANDE